MWKPEERGRAIAIYSLAPLLGPVLGPVCGAWLVILRSGFIMTCSDAYLNRIAERSTWRWVVSPFCRFSQVADVLKKYWSTSIADAAVQVAGLFLLRESAPIILD